VSLLFPQTAKIFQITSQLKHSFKFFPTLRQRRCTFGHSSSNMNRLLVQCLQICFLLTVLTCDVALKCTIFHKSTISPIRTVCICYNFMIFWQAMKITFLLTAIHKLTVYISIPALSQNLTKGNTESQNKII